MRKFRYAFRYSVKSLLLAVAFLCLILFVFLQFTKVRDARQHYHWVRLGWDNDFETIPSVARASERLMEVEASTLWISMNTARRNHMANLQEVLEAAEARHWQVPLTSRDQYEKECQELRVEIEEQQKALAE